MAVGKRRRDAVEVAGWAVDPRLATARVEGQGPQAVEDECGGRCCRHGVYVSLFERDRILEHADRVRAEMDETQTGEVDDWFEDRAEEDEDYPGGFAVGTGIHNRKCVFLNGGGRCVLQQLESSLELAPGERLKPYYCRIFPLTTYGGRLEFDDLCDGLRSCCTLASDGGTRAVDAYGPEFREVLGERGYAELRRYAEEAERELRERLKGNRRKGRRS
jgi:Fe-S-cluster containining protein